MRTYAFLLCLVAGMVLPAIALGQPAAENRAVFYGAGVRFRGLFVPQSIFENFVDVAPSGMSQPELGVEFVRRRGNFDATFGLAWANLSPEDGIWVDDLDDPDDNPSLIEFDGFSWIALDVTAIWKQPLSPTTAFRYGMGVGLGFTMGDILETDYQCPGSRFDVTACTQAPMATAVRKSLDLPAVLPILNTLLGFQYAPSDQVSINIDGGLQTAFFVGISVNFFFQGQR